MSRATMPRRSSISRRMASVHAGAKESHAELGLAHVDPFLLSRLGEKEGVGGVQQMAVAPKSRRSMTWRAVLPDDMGMTVAPTRSAP